MKLSAVVLTHNNAADLAGVLQTIRFANEIVVIDDESSDNTKAMAKKSGARYISRPLNNNWAMQRNAGLQHARGEWVLFIDADERVSQSLAEAIQDAIKNPGDNQGFQIQRIDRFMGKTLRFGETKHIWLTRLGRKTAGLWQRPVHEFWPIQPCGRLAPPLIHEPHASVASFVQKVRRYAQIDARFRYANGEHWSLGDTIVFPIGKWIRNVIINQAWLDGWPGMVEATIMSYHSWLVRRELYRLTWSSLEKGSLLARWWHRFFWFTIFSLVLGQITRWQVTPTAGVYLFELFMMGQILLSVVQTVNKRVWPCKSPLYLAAGMMLAVFALSLVHNAPHLPLWVSVSAGLYWGRLCLYLAYWWSLRQAKDDHWLALPYRRILLYLGVVWGGLGLVQYVVMPDMRWLLQYGWDDHYFRAIGTILDPGFLGILLVLTLILLDEHRGRYYYVTYGVTLLALGFTYARSAYLAYGLAVGLLATQKSWRWLGWRLGWLVLLVFLLPRPGGEGVRLERTYSIGQRVETSVGAIQLFRQSPWLGIGFNAYRYYTQTVTHRFGSNFPVHPSAPDNSWLFILATTGVIGLASWLYFNGLVLWENRLTPIVWVSWIVVLAHAFTNNTYFYVFVLAWLGMLVADVKLL